MEWIHCNDCYKQMSICPDVEFLLTPCTKIQCSSCHVSNSCAKKNCQACRKQNFSTVRLDDSMPSAVADFFRDPLDHLKKFLKVHEFQSNHRNRLLKHQSEQQQETATQAAQWQRVTNDLKNQNRKLQSENHVVREENARLKAQLQEIESRVKKDRKHKADDLDKRHAAAAHSNGSADSRFAVTPLQDTIAATSTGRMPAPSAPGPIRQRVSQHKPKPNPPFLNLQTPAYFPSGQQTPIQVARLVPGANKTSRLVTPNIQSSSYQGSQVHKSQTSQVQVKYQKVYSFMAAAAQEALTPEQPAKR